MISRYWIQLIFLCLIVAAGALEANTYVVYNQGQDSIIMFNLTSSDNIRLYSFHPISNVQSVANCTSDKANVILFEKNLISASETTKASFHCTNFDGSISFQIWYHNETSNTLNTQIFESIQISTQIIPFPLEKTGSVTCYYRKKPYETPFTFGKEYLLNTTDEKITLRFPKLIQGNISQGDIFAFETYDITLKSKNNNQATLLLESEIPTSKETIMKYKSRSSSSITFENITIFVPAQTQTIGSFWVSYNVRDFLIVENIKKENGEFFFSAFSPTTDTFSNTRSIFLQSIDEDMLYIPWTNCETYYNTYFAFIQKLSDKIIFNNGNAIIDTSTISTISGEMTSGKKEYTENDRLNYKIETLHTHFTFEEPLTSLTAFVQWSCPKLNPDLVMTKIYNHGVEFFSDQFNCTREYPINSSKNPLRGSGSFTWSHNSTLFPYSYHIKVNYAVIDPISFKLLTKIETETDMEKLVNISIKNHYNSQNYNICFQLGSGWLAAFENDANIILEKICGDYFFLEGETKIITVKVKASASATGDSEMIITAQSTTNNKIKANSTKKTYLKSKLVSSFKPTISCEALADEKNKVLMCNAKVTNTGDMGDVIHFSTTSNLLSPEISPSIVTILTKDEFYNLSSKYSIYYCQRENTVSSLLQMIDKAFFYGELLIKLDVENNVISSDAQFIFEALSGALIENSKSPAVKDLITALTTSPDTVKIDQLNVLSQYKIEVITNHLKTCQLNKEPKAKITVIACSENPEKGCLEETIEQLCPSIEPDFTFTATSQNVDVKTNSEGSVKIIIENKLSFPVMFDVQLSTDCSFVSTLKKPENAIFIYESEISFQTGTSAESCSINIDASPKGIPEAKKSLKININVNKIEIVDFEISAPFKLESPVGEDIFFKLNITNIGNREDSYIISLSGLENTVIDETTFEQTVSPAQVHVIPFSIPIPSNKAFNSEILKFKIDVTSKNNNTSKKSHNLDVKLLMPKLEIITPKEIKNSETIKLKNTGSIAGTFKFSFSGELKDCISIEKTELTLNADESKELKISLFCKAQELYNKNYQLTLKVEGSGIKIERFIDVFIPTQVTLEASATPTQKPIKKSTPTPAKKIDIGKSKSTRIEVQDQMDRVREKLDEIKDENKRAEISALLNDANNALDADHPGIAMEKLDQAEKIAIDTINDQGGQSSGSRIIVLIILALFILTFIVMGGLYMKNLKKQQQIRANIKKAMTQHSPQQNRNMQQQMYRT